MCLVIVLGLTVALVWAVRAALRGGGAWLPPVAFFSATLASFEAQVRWIGVDRAFNGASLEAFGLLFLLVPSLVAGAVTAIALPWAVQRHRRKHDGPPERSPAGRRY